MDSFSKLCVFVKEHYPEVEVLRNLSISYIKLLTGEDKFIFICQQNTTNVKEFAIENNSECSYNLDLTGSPLKDNLELDDMNIDLEIAKSSDNYFDDSFGKSEERFLPIKIEKALSILNYMNMSNENKLNDCIWVLCKGKNSNNTLLLCSNVSKKIVRNAKVFYRGVIPASKINMSEIMKIHTSGIGRVKVDTKVECTLFISKNAYLKSVWSTSSSNPPLNKFRNSDITLYQIVDIGKSSSVLNDFWEELIILSRLRNDIINYDENYETKQICNIYNSLSLEDIRERILSLLTNSSKLEEEENNSEICEIETIIKNAKNRSYFDISDELWKILKCCCTYGDLKSAFNYIFFCAEKCNIINMPSNQSKLAEIIIDISEYKKTIPFLNGTKHIELFLDLGIEKIFKDYNYIFQTSKICTTTQLLDNLENLNFDVNTKQSTVKSIFDSKRNKNSPIPQRKSLFHIFNNEKHKEVETDIDFNNEKFDPVLVDKKISRLFQIHLLLEHLIIQVNLNLENNYQLFEQLLKRPIKSFQNILNSSIDKVEIPVLINDVLHLLQNKNPQERKISFSSKNEFKELKSTFYYNQKNIFPAEIFPELFPSNSKKGFQECTYHHWHVIDVKTKI